MKLSVIVPVYNEINYIEELIKSLENIDDTEKEILIVDGGSNDGTQQKLQLIAAAHSNIRMIANPARYVSNGFNKAFREAKGQYLALIGAHAIYPRNYFKECIQVIEEGVCEASGGFLIHKGKTAKGKSIAKAMSSKFGVGDTDFRTNPKRSYVESVAFAIYHKKVFERIGMFDEALVRNQDDEFHYRLNKAGFRILMLPELKVIYFVRESLKKLYLQYYQYGLYKPLVFKKVKSGMRLRHLIPSLFVIYLISLLLSYFQIIWILPLLLYFILALYFGWKGAEPFSSKLFTPIVFPVLHIAYGWGFIKGLWKWRNYRPS